MSKILPARPNLEQLKNQAKDLHKAVKAADAAAWQRVRENHPDHAPESRGLTTKDNFSLSDAQWVVAREYGFASWTKLKEHVEATGEDALQAFIGAIQSNDAKAVEDALTRFPGLKAWLNTGSPDHNFGTTPLLAAVHQGNKEMVEVFLRAGADINARSNWWAGSFGVLDDDHGLAPFLIEKGAVVDVHAAARLGMMDRLRELITATPKLVHARGGDGQTPLHFAASVEIAKFLLDHGANIDAKDVDHESTPAQWMIKDRQPIVRYLVSRGCKTDILMAAALGDLELVRKHLADDPHSIEMQVSNEWFPMSNHRCGGSIYIWTLGKNKTAHSVAHDFGHSEIFDFLIQQTNDELKLTIAGELGLDELTKEILGKNPRIIQQLSTAQKRKLVDAAMDNNTGAVQRMLELGWPVDVRGQHAGTSLHWAGFHGNSRMTEVLLRHHAPLELLDRDFNATPLGWAIYGSEHGWYCKTGDYAGTVERLLRAGAKRPSKYVGTKQVQEVLNKFTPAA